MTIKFSMDRIKNMDQLYTWTPTYSEELGCPGEEEHYHGTDYCKQVIADVLSAMNCAGALSDHSGVRYRKFFIKKA